jgi:hypothetical protein
MAKKCRPIARRAIAIRAVHPNSANELEHAQNMKKYFVTSQ